MAHASVVSLYREACRLGGSRAPAQSGLKGPASVRGTAFVGPGKHQADRDLTVEFYGRR